VSGLLALRQPSDAPLLQGVAELGLRRFGVRFRRLRAAERRLWLEVPLPLVLSGHAESLTPY